MTKKTAVAVLLPVAALLLLTFSSCSKADVPAPAYEGDLPDMIMTNASYTLGKPDRTPLTMNARQITVYNGNSRTILENPSFSQKAKDSDMIELRGSCDYAQSTDNSSVSLSGNIRIFKNTDNVTIECDTLLWDDEQRMMSTPGIVRLSYPDGTYITARGLTASLDSNLYEFEEIIQGRFEIDQE